MTEEEVRPEYTPPGALQPDEKIESQKSLTDKNNELLTGTLRFQQIQEQKTMQDPAQTSPNPQKPGTPEYARDEFLEIKKALVGPKDEWCLPKIDKKARESSPRIEDSALQKIATACNDSRKAQ
jgi:hypothetical protein